MGSVDAAELAEIFAPDESLLEYLAACRAQGDDESEPPDEDASEGDDTANERIAVPRRKPDPELEWKRFGYTPLADVWDGAPLPTQPTRGGGLSVDQDDPCYGVGLLRQIPLRPRVWAWSERDLTLQMLLVVRGLPSESLHPTGEPQLADEVVVPGLTPASLAGLVDLPLRMSGSLRRIKHTLAALEARCPTPHSPVERCSGVAPLVPSLTKAVRMLLDTLTAFYIEVERVWRTSPERPATPSPCTLQRLSRMLRESKAKGWIEVIDETVSMAKSLEDDRYGMTVLLSRLHRLAVKTQDGGHEAADAAAAIFFFCLRPYLTELGVWMSSGRIWAPSPTLEPMLFIVESQRRPLEAFADWDKRWRIQEERLPCFIPTDLARSIMTTGKSVRFLTTLRAKLIRSDHWDEASQEGLSEYCQVPPLPMADRFFESVILQLEAVGATAGPPRLNTASVEGVDPMRVGKAAQFPLASVGHESIAVVVYRTLRRLVDEHGDRVGKELVGSLTQHSHFHEHMNLLRGFFLLQNGAVMQHFCSMYLFPIAHRGSLGGRPGADEMLSCFQRSVLTFAQGNDLKAALGLRARWEEEGQDIASLRFRAGDDKPQCIPEREAAPEALRIVGGFVLQLQDTDGPMDILLPKEVTRAYERVLQVLLMTAYCKHLLVKVSLPKLPWRASELDTLIAVTRLNLLGFIQALYDHLLQQTNMILEKGLKELAACVEVDRYREVQMDTAAKLLSAIQFTAKQKDYWAVLMEVHRLVVRFEASTRLYLEWLRGVALEASLLKRKERGYTPAPAEAPATLQDSMRALPTILRIDILSQFKRHVQFIITTLKSQPGRGAELVMRFQLSRMAE